MPTIAIDYTPAYEQGAGIGRYVRELVSALAQHDHQTEYRLFVSGTPSNNDLPNFPTNYQWKTTRLSPKWLARLWHRLHLPLHIERFVGDIDLYHATDFVLPPTHKSTKTILTVHDLSFIRVAETASPSLRQYLNRVVPISVQRATHILADSQATKDDLIELYSTPKAKITVLLSGIQEHYKPIVDDQKLADIQAKYNIPNRPYLFSVGTVQPRKNYGRIIQALAQLRQQDNDLSFVIAGGKGWLEDEMYETIEQTQMSEYVHLIGFVDDADLPALYTSAEITVFSSLYEGFGFPVLESMACGTPVITSNVSSLPEVGGDVALFVNPTSVDEIRDAIQQLIDDNDLRQNLRQRGLEHIKKFSWPNSAKKLKQIYDSVLQS